MIWFSSDHHFYHTNVIRYCSRPFATVEEMNEEMVRRWNVCVRPEDTVYYLGDFSLAKRPVELFLPRLNGIKHLIAGNHDHCHPIHAKKEAKRAKMEEFYKQHGFASVKLEDSIMIAGRCVTMHHMPFNEDHGEQLRYEKWRPKDDGQWLLCGHIHEKWKQRGRMINVGVDVWSFAPVSLDEIKVLIQERSE